MGLKQVVRMLALGVGLGLGGIVSGCGPAPLGPTEQVKADAVIKKEHVSRHQEVKAAQQLQSADQKNQGASRRAAHRGQ